jgi:hypothetical protein
MSATPHFASAGVHQSKCALSPSQKKAWRQSWQRRHSQKSCTRALTKRLERVTARGTSTQKRIAHINYCHTLPRSQSLVSPRNGHFPARIATVFFVRCWTQRGREGLGTGVSRGDGGRGKLGTKARLVLGTPSQPCRGGRHYENKSTAPRSETSGGERPRRI